MASASANRTYAQGSIDPVYKRERLMPSATIGTGGGSFSAVPQRPMGMDYSQKFRTGPANFKAGRGNSVSQIMGQREGNVAARYADGRAVPYGMPIRVPGFNTSGVGQGTPGYRGSGRIQGYSFENQGNAASKRGASNYSPYFGGLNEFYQNQQGLGQWDQLQNQKGMDQQDAFGSRLAQMSAFAAGRGDMETAGAYAQALQQRAAQQMAAQGGDPWSQAQSFPTGFGSAPAAGGAGIPLQVDLPSWMSPVENAANAVGASFMGGLGAGTGGGSAQVGPSPNPDFTPEEIGAALAADARLRTRQAAGDQWETGEIGEAAFRSNYGTGYTSPSPRTGPATFTNAQGSIGPGSVYTNYGGRQGSGAFFQDAADRTRQGNAYAQPTDFTQPPTGMSLGDYSRRLMEVKNKLGAR